MSDINPADIDRAVGGILALIVLVVGCGMCCSSVGGGMGSTRSDEIRACAAACGDTGMASWDGFDGCTCREVQP